LSSPPTRSRAAPATTAEVATSSIWPLHADGAQALALGLTEPLKAGLGLLTFLAGFQLFYYALEQALVLIGFFGAASRCWRWRRRI
jgi:hypothetical protein